ncbi:SDR family oxidoreductase [Actinomadura sp. B10D3]|uniref:SDR family oxidoreductase n=1 Tax=Actinomadura sp. B10D3 TaxID=3153557 RepID=UPI00325EEB07
MSTNPDVLLVASGGPLPRGIEAALGTHAARVSSIDLSATPAPGEVERALADHLARVGTPTVLVNLLHAQEPGSRPEEITNAALERGIAVNLTRTLLTCQKVGQAMIEAGGGTIVVVLAGAADDPVSSVTDTAARGLVRVLGVEWAPQRVRVAAVSPTGAPGAGRDAAVTETVGFLMSEDASYVTGAIVPVRTAVPGAS